MPFEHAVSNVIHNLALGSIVHSVKRFYGCLTSILNYRLIALEHAHVVKLTSCIHNGVRAFVEYAHGISSIGCKVKNELVVGTYCQCSDMLLGNIITKLARWQRLAFVSSNLTEPIIEAKLASTEPLYGSVKGIKVSRGCNFLRVS